MSVDAGSGHGRSGCSSHHSAKRVKCREYASAVFSVSAEVKTSAMRACSGSPSKSRERSAST